MGASANVRAPGPQTTEGGFGATCAADTPGSSFFGGCDDGSPSEQSGESGCASPQRVVGGLKLPRYSGCPEDHSRGPGRVVYMAPDTGFGLEGTPKPKIQRDPSIPKRKPYLRAAAVRRGGWEATAHQEAPSGRRLLPGSCAASRGLRCKLAALRAKIKLSIHYPRIRGGIGPKHQFP